MCQERGMRHGGTQATAEEFPAVVGILWNAPRAGETAIVHPVGSGCWSFTLEGPARANFSLVVEAARALGYQVPDRFLGYAGQMYYRNGRLEEVRLLGGVLGEWDAERRTTLTYWSTPTLPTIVIGPDGKPYLDPTDTDRSHLSPMSLACLALRMAIYSS
jgi:hypothetical protein